METGGGRERERQRCVRRIVGTCAVDMVETDGMDGQGQSFVSGRRRMKGQRRSESKQESQIERHC